jgi:hypothetical protein
MQTGTALTFDVARTLASASMTGSYIALGTKLSNPCRIIKIVNNTNQDVSVSIDGVSLYDFIPAGGFVLYDAGCNRSNASPELSFPQGMQFYVSSAAGMGSLYLITLFPYPQNFPY